MRHVPLWDALGLLAPCGANGDRKYERASARWLARLPLEKPELTIVEAQLAALNALPAHQDTAMRVLFDRSR